MTTNTLRTVFRDSFNKQAATLDAGNPKTRKNKDMRVSYIKGVCDAAMYAGLATSDQLDKVSFLVMCDRFDEAMSYLEGLFTAHPKDDEEPEDYNRARKVCVLYTK